jgi:nucleoside-diphosphate-sugar epimerase
MNTWAGASIVVTGGAGFIGANLVRRLAALGARVHAVVAPSSPLWRLEDEAAIVLHRADLTDAPALEGVIRRAAPVLVFHLAARGAARHGLGTATLVHANVIGTVNLLEATSRVPLVRFVHVGGSSEYGPHDGPMREDDRLDPITPYGASKAAATLLCRQTARAHGRPIVILRPFSVYGPWESPSRLVPSAIRAAVDGCELPLTAPGYRRDLVHVDDVVDACLAAAAADLPPGEIVNVGTGQEWTNEDVVSAISTVMGRVIRTRPGEYDARLSDTAHWVADVRKAERLLGWTPRRMLREGLEQTVQWWTARPAETLPRG